MVNGTLIESLANVYTIPQLSTEKSNMQDFIQPQNAKINTLTNI